MSVNQLPILEAWDWGSFYDLSYTTTDNKFAVLFIITGPSKNKNDQTSHITVTTSTTEVAQEVEAN